MTKEDWFLSEGTIDGLRTFVRGREMLPESVRPESHGKLLRIVWEYGGDPVNRMPSAAISSEMSDFEDLIVPCLERDSCCALFAVVTHDGRRYWQFYCRDWDETQSAIANALGAEGDLPIDLQMEDDPQWTVLSKVLSEQGRKN
jgi:hypothetical protein